jgi:hypothetical protein
MEIVSTGVQEFAKIWQGNQLQNLISIAALDRRSGAVFLQIGKAYTCLVLMFWGAMPLRRWQGCGGEMHWQQLNAEGFMSASD